MSTPRLSVSFSPEYPLIPHLRQVSAAADNSDLLQPLLASAERRALLAFPDSTASCTLLHSSEPPIATCFSKPLPRLPLEYLIDALNEHFALEVDRVSQHIRETNKSIEGYKNAQHDRLQKQRERFVTQYKYVTRPRVYHFISKVASTILSDYYQCPPSLSVNPPSVMRLVKN
ncbi:hypothetical protein H2248_005104 [Termitomyces sp. 'cryptogamus']|nr:hypothetical protein H2248_005104 [Termitomyces sp. 'cryptogamus']